MICASCTRPTEHDPCERCGEGAQLDGRYRLETTIGRGASGTTWRATGPDGQAVAIKAMPLGLVEEPKQRELLEREVRVLRELSHSGIPAYQDHLVQGGGDDAVLWLVQELVPGCSLREEMADHRYEPREVLAIVAELAGILDHLHSLSPPVIHRDVKPGNVMRRPEGGLVLIDFGAVRDVAKSSLGGSTVAGTFGYMAPEQFAGDAEPRSDLYGLGALAVTLLTRREPQTLLDHANRLRWTKHANVAGSMHDLVNRLVEPGLDRRAPSAAWVQQRAELMLATDDLEPSSPQPVAAPVDHLLERKPRDLRWWLMAGAAVLTVAAVPAALVLNSARWFAPKPPPEPTLLPSGPPSAEPREERPIAARPEAAAPEPITDPLQRIVSAIGDDTLIEICVEQHRARFPDEVVRLEVHLEPPNEVVAVEVGPPSLQDAEVVSCLEHATMVLALREVTLERPGSVIIAFD